MSDELENDAAQARMDDLRMQRGVPDPEVQKMLRRPSLANSLVMQGPFSDGEFIPWLKIITSNQLNALRDYILELEEKDGS